MTDWANLTAKYLRIGDIIDLSAPRLDGDLYKHRPPAYLRVMDATEEDAKIHVTGIRLTNPKDRIGPVHQQTFAIHALLYVADGGVPEEALVAAKQSLEDLKA